MSKIVLSTNTIPAEFELIEIHGFTEYTQKIEISDKGLIRNITERNRNEHQEALDNFVRNAGNQGNVIFDVKISTAVGQFKNGTFLYKTYYGTVATVERKSPN
ncbi:conserved hypothetical protein [Xenorhabdus bovienii str. oregonense]|uniref:Heavy metal-binding domain-containing protein n=1 Tax=Xenorhabdus bovienii str. oregonense TaxID=1398202 RepID=A0A077NQY0_XENBV|nr:hypothetical protein [Xenorhabdus bovienii]CDH04527.1 conserved hypothetical protein [Xenorhabdus bovienii str. oregonense]